MLSMAIKMRLINEPRPTTHHVVIHLAQRLGMDDPFALIRGSDRQQFVHELRDPVSTLGGDDALLLLGPAWANQIASVIAQFLLQSRALRTLIAAEIAVQGRETRRLLGDQRTRVGVVLVGGDRKQPEQKSIEDEEIREGKLHHFISARLGIEPGAEEITNDEDGQKQYGEKDDRKQGRYCQ